MEDNEYLEDNSTPKETEPKEDASKKYSSYGSKLQLLLICSMLIFIGVILTIQYNDRSYTLRERANSTKNFRTDTVPAKRGHIYSHDKKLLATSISEYTIHMDFKTAGMSDSLFNADVKMLAKGLSEILKDKSAKTYEKQLKYYRTKKKRYVKITTQPVNHIVYSELMTLPLLKLAPNKGGKIITHNLKRHLPNGSLARRTIGRDDQRGRFGLESSFTDVLMGENGYTYMKKISGSFWVPDNNKEHKKEINGNDIVTTLDLELQGVAEDALKKGISENNANWGTAILMEVATGEIKAIANISRDDKGNMYEDMNHALIQSMEPGSTFKLATLISLLDEGGADLDELIDCGTGIMKVGNRKYVDTKKDLGVVSLKRVFEVSSNIGFAKSVLKYYGDNQKNFTNDIIDMGFLNKLDLQIKGERQPKLFTPKDKSWHTNSLGMLSTGYDAILTNPIRMLMLYNAIANNGKMITPLFVKQIEKNGKILENYKSEVINGNICSAKTLNGVRNAMEGVIYEGTGRYLFNKNYKIAGKSGTAQISTGGTYFGNKGIHYLASFAGYFPADKPEYSCIVVIKTFKPRGVDMKYGGSSLAGPVFKTIADRVYAYAVDWGGNVEKPTVDENGKPSYVSVDNKPKVIKNKKGKVIRNISLTAKRGDVDNLKGVFRAMDMSNDCVIKVNNQNIGELENLHSNINMIPDVIGMGLKDAIDILMPMGIIVKSKGKGTITKQSKEPGLKFVKGEIITLELEL